LWIGSFIFTTCKFLSCIGWVAGAETFTSQWCSWACWHGIYMSDVLWVQWYLCWSWHSSCPAVVMFQQGRSLQSEYYITDINVLLKYCFQSFAVHRIVELGWILHLFVSIFIIKYYTMALESSLKHSFRFRFNRLLYYSKGNVITSMVFIVHVCLNNAFYFLYRL